MSPSQLSTPAPAPAADWTPHIQVPSSHYGPAYEDHDKWLCYYWQIRNVADRGARNVLEIGVGSQVVSSYLRRVGVQLTTLDIDPQLHPDFVGSVTQLPFADGSFDAILCTEVLEHMPFEQSQQAMRELARCSRRFAFVAVPQFAISSAVLVRLPVLHLRELRLQVPWPRRIPLPIGEHHWECGRLGYPPRRIRQALRAAGFSRLRQLHVATNYSSLFFELEK